jgi:Fic family protein
MSYKEHFIKIDELKILKNAFGSLSEDQMNSINYEYRAHWNYYSNRMEGNTLTIEETKDVMTGNISIDYKPLKDVLEMHGHEKVINEILGIGAGNHRISEKRIKDIHQAIIYEEDSIKKNKIGIWKTEPNMIYKHKGEKFDFASSVEVPNRIHDLLNKMNAEIDKIISKKENAKHPIEIALDFQLDFLEIHPFYDGNGRTARILCNQILISNGYSPFWITDDERKKYYYIISEIQGYEGDRSLFYEFCSGLIERSEQIIVDVLKKN